MGNGYWILVWDGYGPGMSLVNPRLLTHENGLNAFACRYTGDMSDDELAALRASIRARHRLDKTHPTHHLIIFHDRRNL